MENELNWAAEVRRWSEAGKPPLSSSAPSRDDGDVHELGYEAAYPALQARHWPDASDGAEERR